MLSVAHRLAVQIHRIFGGVLLEQRVPLCGVGTRLLHFCCVLFRDAQRGCGGILLVRMGVMTYLVDGAIKCSLT
jgi:hypothetical protein